MKIIAHRGFSGVYPENTMLAFEKAISAGSDGIELDVHLSKDGHPMIIHDENLIRTSGVDAFIFNLTRAEAEKVSVGKTFNDSYGHTPIPSLDEYLSFMANHKDRVTNIELKTAPVYYPGLEEIVINLVRKYNLEDNIIFSSFNPFSCVKVKRLAPDIECGFLFSGAKMYNFAPLLQSESMDYYHPDIRDIDESYVNSFKPMGIGLNVWTVNDEKDMANCIKWGINGLITNYPDKAIALLNK